MKVSKLSKILIVIIVILVTSIGFLSYFIVNQNININNSELKIARQNIDDLKIQNKTLKLKIKYLQYVEYFKHNNKEPVILYNTNSCSYWESILLLDEIK